MDFLNTIFTNYLNIGLGVAAAFIMLLILLAGALYAASSTNERMAEHGKTAIRAALIGGTIMLGAKGFWTIVSTAVPH
jgi:hypothetical protein